MNRIRKDSRVFNTGKRSKVQKAIQNALAAQERELFEKFSQIISTRVDDEIRARLSNKTNVNSDEKEQMPELAEDDSDISDNDEDDFLSATRILRTYA